MGQLVKDHWSKLLKTTAVVTESSIKQSLRRALEEGAISQQMNSTSYNGNNYTTTVNGGPLAGSIDPLSLGPGCEDPYQDAKAAFILMAAGLAFITVLVGFSIIIKKYCSCSSNHFVEHSRSSERERGMDHGPIAKKAGLKGVITKNERRQIFIRILEGKISIFHQQNSQYRMGGKEAETDTSYGGDDTHLDEEVKKNGDGDHHQSQNHYNEQGEAMEKGVMKEASQNEHNEKDAMDKCFVREEKGSTSVSLPAQVELTTPSGHAQHQYPASLNEDASIKNVSDNDRDSIVLSDEKQLQLQNLQEQQLDHTQVCCICLVPYAQGDKLVQGTTGCGHVFHYDCCMEWLMRQHDICPYCRTEMILGSEYHTTAFDIIGKDRVAELAKFQQNTEFQETTGTSSAYWTAYSNSPAIDTITTTAITTPLETTRAHHNDLSQQEGIEMSTVESQGVRTSI